MSNAYITILSRGSVNPNISISLDDSRYVPMFRRWRVADLTTRVAPISAGINSAEGWDHVEICNTLDSLITWFSNCLAIRPPIYHQFRNKICSGIFKWYKI